MTCIELCPQHLNLEISDHCSAQLCYQEFLILLKGGASLDLNSVKAKPFRWMLDIIWLNLVELCNLETFKAEFSTAEVDDSSEEFLCHQPYAN